MFFPERFLFPGFLESPKSAGGDVSGGVEGEKLFFLVKNFFHCYTEIK
jgi:hypothetical protein